MANSDVDEKRSPMDGSESSQIPDGAKVTSRISRMYDSKNVSIMSLRRRWIAQDQATRNFHQCPTWLNLLKLTENGAR